METRSFTDFMNQVIEDLKKEERYGTAHIYGYALRAFCQYVEMQDIPFSVFTKAEMKQFQVFLLEKQRSWNTISTYFRVLRAVYNRAVDDDLIEGEYRLFSGVFTGVTSEKKLALDVEDMQKLIDESKNEEVAEVVNASKGLLKARYLLTLMLLLQGIGFADLIHLRKENMKKSAKGQYILHFRRQKTGTELTIQVSPEAMQIIHLYPGAKSSPYLLNLLDGVGKGVEAYQEYRRQLRNFNYNLARLATLCGLSGKVSSYSARHTWATLAKFCEVPEEVISEALGHSSLEVTRTYLKRFESDKMEKANKIIIDYVINGRKQMWNTL